MSEPEPHVEDPQQVSYTAFLPLQYSPDFAHCAATVVVVVVPVVVVDDVVVVAVASVVVVLVVPVVVTTGWHPLLVWANPFAQHVPPTKYPQPPPPV